MCMLGTALPPSTSILMTLCTLCVQSCCMEPTPLQGIPAPNAPQPQASAAPLQRPVKRPITIQPPPDAPQQQQEYAQQQQQEQRGRRYSAMAGHAQV